MGKVRWSFHRLRFAHVIVIINAKYLGSFIDLSQNSPFIMADTYGIWDGKENKIESILEKPHMQKKFR